MTTEKLSNLSKVTLLGHGRAGSKARQLIPKAASLTTVLQRPMGNSISVIRPLVFLRLIFIYSQSIEKSYKLSPWLLFIKKERKKKKRLICTTTVVGSVHVTHASLPGCRVQCPAHFVYNFILKGWIYHPFLVLLKLFQRY